MTSQETKADVYDAQEWTLFNYNRKQMQMTWEGTNLMIIFILFLSFKTLNQVLLDQPIHSTCQLFTWTYKIEDKVNS